MFMSEIYTHTGQKVSPRPPQPQMHDERAQALQWYVLLVKPIKEDAVAAILRDHGVTPVVPKIERRTHARRYRGPRSRSPNLKPILPGYVIAGFNGPPNWFAVQKQHLITNVLGVRGVPQMVNPKDVARMSLIGCDGVIPARSPKKNLPFEHDFHAGDRAMVLSGPFADFVVNVESIDDGSAVCGVSIFGRRTEITMNLGNLVRRLR